MTEELEREARVWQDEATAFLASTDLAGCLAPFGRLQYTGSFAYGCMLAPDIDCYVVSDDPSSQERAIAAMNTLAAQNLWNGIQLFDWEHFPSPREKGFPKAFYVGLKQPYGTFRWTVDCWFLTEQQSAAFTHHWIIEGMTGEARGAVLHLKDARRSGLIPGSGFSIYTAVIRDGVSAVDEYQKWWNSVWQEYVRTGSEQ